jgi:hypothetical protein
MRGRIGLGALSLLTGVLLAACSGNVFDLAVGDCFDDGDMAVAGVEEVGDVPMVECSEPHDNEVYAVVTVDGDVFPGEEAIQSTADDMCLEAFDGFVGLDYQTSTLDFGWLVPTADTWAAGDRVVACFVYRMDYEKVTGTLQGTGI